MCFDGAVSRYANFDTVTGDMFCAQLVGTTMMMVGLLPKDHPGNWYNQGSFGHVGKYSDDCAFLDGAAWAAPEQLVQYPFT